MTPRCAGLRCQVMLNEAVAMNNIMQEQSIGSLKSWHMEVQEVHWTLQAHSKLQPVSENRLLLDSVAPKRG